ncbi:homeobox protein Nkx-6.1 [Procambarus clarkii]|uniref:homeobox protein Nkx-6.1 n=1 Tax=Procambarus clarkii TaxID=6728 RepID=UPI0037430902
MVTRYTIDQILSNTHNSPTAANTTVLTTASNHSAANPTVLTIGSDLSAANPTVLTIGSDLSAANPTVLTTASNLSAANPTPLTTASNLSAANPTPLTTGSNPTWPATGSLCSRSPGMPASPTPAAEGERLNRTPVTSDASFGSLVPSSGKYGSNEHPKDEASGVKDDKDLSSNTDRAWHRPALARPVPLRMTHRPGTVPHERHSLAGATSDIRMGTRPDLLYGGAGYDVMYSLMLRQYIEAHYRGLASAGAYLPLPYPVLDQGSGYPAGRGSRRRGGQVRFTSQQTRQLELCFTTTKYITPPQRKDIARDLHLHERQVKTWFQNRRAKWRKVQAQHGDEAVPVASSSPHTSQSDEDDGDPVGEGLTKDDRRPDDKTDDLTSQSDDNGEDVTKGRHSPSSGRQDGRPNLPHSRATVTTRASQGTTTPVV